jgi:NACHT domain
VITGLEPLLAPALAKGAGAGAARVAGWGATEVLASRRRRKIRALTQSKARAPQLAAVAALEPPRLIALQAFCESVECEHIATTLTRAYLLEGAGKKADKLLSNIRAEFESMLKVWLGEPLDPMVVEAVFSALVEAVLQNVRGLLERPKLANSVEAELIATAGSVAAASIRNTDLVAALENLNEIRAFEVEYKMQVAALHATMKLPHAGTSKPVPYDQLFVQPHVAVDRGMHTDVEPAVRHVPLDELFRCTTRLLVLGDPGGGKSTLSRKLVYDVAADALPDFAGRAPFFVELRDYAGSVRGSQRKTLVEYLEHLCKSPYNVEAPEAAIEYLLLNDRAVVVLDGLDELLDVSLRRDVVDAVEGFAHRYPTCPIVVTSRRIGYSEAPLNADLFGKVRLGDFDDAQVADYVHKWFMLDESVEVARQEGLARSFIADSEFVQDLRKNPLMLSLMCGIYASENYIPRNRPDVYEKCALLLFERWDKQRGIVPDLPFDAHVQSALRALALHMFEREQAAQAKALADPEEEALDRIQTEGLSRDVLVRYLAQYLRRKRFDNDEDAESAAVDFLEFCKGRAWVLTDVGAETYGFTHRTFLEYFAASQLVRLHTSAPALYDHMKNMVRAGASDVVAQLAVQILGKTTEDGSDDFLDLLLKDTPGTKTEQANAISFAARALAFVVPRPEVLKAVCQRCVELPPTARRRSHAGWAGVQPVSELMNCSAENVPRVAQALRDSIKSVLAQPENRYIIESTLALTFRPELAFRGRSFHYWIAWAEENFDLFSDELAAGARDYYWLALLQYERGGGVSLEQLLDWHGVKALYDFDVSSVDIDSPPFAFNLIAQADRGGFWDLSYKRVGQARLRQMVADVVDQLPRRKAPWLQAEKRYGALAMLLRRDGLRVPARVAPAHLLLCLPLLEGLHAEARKQLHPVLMEACESRSAGEVSHELDAELRRLFGEEAQDADRFVRSWVSGDVTLVARGRTRGRAARSSLEIAT